MEPKHPADQKTNAIHVSRTAQDDGGVTYHIRLDPQSESAVQEGAALEQGTPGVTELLPETPTRQALRVSPAARSGETGAVVSLPSWIAGNILPWLPGRRRAYRRARLYLAR